MLAITAYASIGKKPLMPNQIIPVRNQGHDTKGATIGCHFCILKLKLYSSIKTNLYAPGNQNLSVISKCYLLYNNML